MYLVEKLTQTATAAATQTATADATQTATARHPDGHRRRPSPAATHYPDGRLGGNALRRPW